MDRGSYDWSCDFGTDCLTSLSTLVPLLKGMVTLLCTSGVGLGTLTEFTGAGTVGLIFWVGIGGFELGILLACGPTIVRAGF